MPRLPPASCEFLWNQKYIVFTYTCTLKSLTYIFLDFFVFFRDLPKHLKIGRLEETSPYVRRCWAKHKKTRDIATSRYQINSKTQAYSACVKIAQLQLLWSVILMSKLKCFMHSVCFDKKCSACVKQVLTKRMQTILQGNTGGIQFKFKTYSHY